jgi:hypothetical protein
VPAIEINGAGGRLFGRAQQVHVDLLQAAAAFPVVASRAGSHDVRPYVFSALVAGLDMVDRQPAIPASTVLAGIIIAAEDLSARKLNPRPGAVDLFLQPDDGGAWQQL